MVDLLTCLQHTHLLFSLKYELSLTALQYNNDGAYTLVDRLNEQCKVPQDVEFFPESDVYYGAGKGV